MNKLGVTKAGLPYGAKQFLREKQFTSNSEYTPVKPSNSGLKVQKTTKILD